MYSRGQYPVHNEYIALMSPPAPLGRILHSAHLLSVGGGARSRATSSLRIALKNYFGPLSTTQSCCNIFLSRNKPNCSTVTSEKWEELFHVHVIDFAFQTFFCQSVSRCGSSLWTLTRTRTHMHTHTHTHPHTHVHPHTLAKAHTLTNLIGCTFLGSEANTCVESVTLMHSGSQLFHNSSCRWRIAG